MSFIPTYLYIKEHNKTGLRYFGKTTRDVFKYKGSGKYWRNHLRAHGNDVTTIWYELFLSIDELVDFAIFFSEEANIVNAVNANGKKIWANSIPEDGLHGGQNKGLPSPLRGRPTGRDSVWKGRKRPDHSALLTGRTQTKEHSEKISKALAGKERSIAHSENISKSKMGKKAAARSCSECSRQISLSNYAKHVKSCTIKKEQ